MKASLIKSAIAHVLFFLFLFISMPTTVHKSEPVMPVIREVVKATTVDKKSIDAAIKRQELAELREKQKIADQKKKAEQLKRDAEKAKKELALAKKKKAETEAQALAAKKEAAKQEALEKQRVADEKARIKEQEAKDSELLKLAQAKAAKALELAEWIGSEVERYKAEFVSAIEDNRILSSAFPSDVMCRIRIRLLPDGSVMSVSILESSGHNAYDEMSETAIYKTAPFPMPDDQDVYNKLRDIVLSFKNGEQTVGLL